MRYSLTVREELWKSLRSHLFDHGNVERAAYIFAGIAKTDKESRLLASRWEPVEDPHIDWATQTGLQIDAASYRSAFKSADRAKERLIFVHSHPDDVKKHSIQDDAEEAALFRSAYARMHNAGPHASLVLTPAGSVAGRVWLEGGQVEPLSVIRIFGRTFQFVDAAHERSELPMFFDRQVRAFGPDIQRLLGTMHVGVVGVGGTGSAVFEQLVRLGVGQVTVADDDHFDVTNVNRVYGSCSSDEGLSKALIARRNAAHVDVDTKTLAIGTSVLSEDVLKMFRSCDVVFSCVDRELPRSLLNTLSLYYLVPVFDMGVEIDSENGAIRSITGRVTTLFPGNACLYCRSIITNDIVRAESVAFTNPGEHERLRGLHYAPELGRTDPAVITFTTAVASFAVSELLHRLTGFAGSDRQSTEVRIYFDQTRMRTTATAPRPECYCSDRSNWGRGDRSPFLDMAWVS